ncbi:ATP-dependent DNA helicase RecG [Psychrobacillus sp. FSL H8-0510]|uniref:ATP-dependent DNA helicase RecG n=1 Tax=Psychrobacillus sp. FSL H8-0510 TaxID=2921394 RepID=UPI0030F521B3
MTIGVLELPKAKENQLKAKGIETMEELVGFIPRKYKDYRAPMMISQVKYGEDVAVIGKITGKKSSPKTSSFQLVDEQGKKFSVVWFGAEYMLKKYEEGDTVIVGGVIEYDKFSYGPRFTVPFLFTKDSPSARRIYPIYSKIKGMSEEYLTKTIHSALSVHAWSETLELSVRTKFQLMDGKKAIETLHRPKALDAIEHAKKTKVFEDLFTYAMKMEEKDRTLTKVSPYRVKDMALFNTIHDKLPFNLTDGQKDVITEVHRKLKAGDRVEALVQGDVGCGKTIVAILLMSILVGSGHQAAIMAPTQVLAKQHFEEVERILTGTPYKVAFLSGDMKVREKKKVIKEIAEGEVQVIVGTHAVISKDVRFKSLAMTIVDEEHRFGVKQREALREKARAGVHHIGMSATPIPRTLAFAVLGETVDVFSIKSMPNGRKPVRTVRLETEERAWTGVVGQVEKGHQAYVVCPLIDESDAEAMQGVKSVEETFKELQELSKKEPLLKVEMISGKMKGSEVEEAIGRFTRGETNVLVSTTIIEVGVNVPNATIIVLRNAERFGLAQLHQLRGRVGRGDKASYCILLSKAEGQRKLDVMTRTNDGFVVASEDLALRGTGDFIGTEQSGQNPYVDLIINHREWYNAIREEVQQVFNDPRRLHFYRIQQVLGFEEDAS